MKVGIKREEKLSLAVDWADFLGVKLHIGLSLVVCKSNAPTAGHGVQWLYIARLGKYHFRGPQWNNAAAIMLVKLQFPDNFSRVRQMIPIIIGTAPAECGFLESASGYSFG